MKRIEDIEKMDLSAMDSLFEDTGVKAPVRLKESVRLRIASEEVITRAAKKEKMAHAAVPAFGLAFAAACVGAIVMLGSGPKDTFDSPELAYAELERALGYISEKMDKGMDIASQAGPVIENISEAIYLINN